MVLAGGPGERAGLVEGDVITAINGVAPKAIDPDRMKAIFTSPAPIRLEVRRPDGTATLTLTPERVRDAGGSMAAG